MTKIISIFNNKGGVGKTTISWNLADSMARENKKILLVDFDPQCNLSIAMLGMEKFKTILSQGSTIRAYTQPFIQNQSTSIVTHKSSVANSTHSNVDLVAGDFWLNVYSDAITIGQDLLLGLGLGKFTIIKKLVEDISIVNGYEYDYVLIDLPPAFNNLVRTAFYSSDYYIIPCTSDDFCVYCSELIGGRIPEYILEFGLGLDANKRQNQNSPFTNYGQPKYAGWIFNAFDEAKKRNSEDETKVMVQADKAYHDRLKSAMKDKLVSALKKGITTYEPLATNLMDSAMGEVDDANILIQNSFWLNVPIGQLAHHKQVRDLNDKGSWAGNQQNQIKTIRKRFEELAKNVIKVCV